MVNPVTTYHAIPVQTLALVVEGVRHAQPISTVLVVYSTKNPNSWERAPIKRGMTQHVLSLWVSPLFPHYIL